MRTLAKCWRTLAMSSTDHLKQKFLKEQQKKIFLKQENLKKEKTYRGEYYTVNSIFGNDWAMWYALLGGREAGKSYSVMNWACNRKKRKGEKLKIYWFRLSDQSVKNLLKSGGEKLIDPDLQRKYNVKTYTKGDDVFWFTPGTYDSKGREVKKNALKFATVLSCATFYNTKGVGYFDNEFTKNGGEYLIVLDEMNRELSEKNSFDIVYNFVNLIENTIRSTKNNVKIVMIGNTLEESSDILAAFNFLPETFGRYKLKSKRLVVDYIKPNEAYKERRKGTAADILAGDSSTFTNEVEIDRSLLCNKRLCVTPVQIIKFTKIKDTWFTLWNNNIIRQYKNENKPVIAMQRYLDEQFELESQKAIFTAFDARAFKFTEISTFKRFQKQLRLIKKR